MEWMNLLDRTEIVKQAAMLTHILAKVNLALSDLLAFPDTEYEILRLKKEFKDAASLLLSLDRELNLNLALSRTQQEISTNK